LTVGVWKERKNKFNFPNTFGVITGCGSGKYGLERERIKGGR
jgi:hypothetical protein